MFIKYIDGSGTDKESLQRIKDALADVICWHNGYYAAKPDYEGPPGLSVLKDFGADLQCYINRVKPDAQ